MILKWLLAGIIAFTVFADWLRLLIQKVSGDELRRLYKERGVPFKKLTLHAVVNWTMVRAFAILFILYLP